MVSQIVQGIQTNSCHSPFPVWEGGKIQEKYLVEKQVGNARPMLPSVRSMWPLAMWLDREIYIGSLSTVPGTELLKSLEFPKWLEPWKCLLLGSRGDFWTPPKVGGWWPEEPTRTAWSPGRGQGLEVESTVNGSDSINDTYVMELP